MLLSAFLASSALLEKERPKLRSIRNRVHELKRLTHEFDRVLSLISWSVLIGRSSESPT